MGLELDHIGDVEIAAGIAVAGFEHRHRTHIAKPHLDGPVEALDDQDRLAVDGVQCRVRDVDAGAASELERDYLPADHVPLVARRAWELRDRDTAIPVEHVGLRARASERAAAAQQHPELVLTGFVALEPFGGAEQFGKCEEGWNPGTLIGQVGIAAGVPKAQRALAQVVADAE